MRYISRRTCAVSKPTEGSERCPSKGMKEGAMFVSWILYLCPALYTLPATICCNTISCLIPSFPPYIHPIHTLHAHISAREMVTLPRYLASNTWKTRRLVFATQRPHWSRVYSSNGKAGAETHCQFALISCPHISQPAPKTTHYQASPPYRYARQHSWEDRRHRSPRVSPSSQSPLSRLDSRRRNRGS